MELFHPKIKKSRTEALPIVSSEVDKDEEVEVEESEADEDESSFATTFTELGVCEWLADSCTALGMRQPTPVQRCCIPAAMKRLDIIGLAETGSGKTAAFAIPMLQRLSEDPYGIFGLILTPTRELAIQIAEQVSALGAPISVRVCTIIGGVNATTQSLELATQPHIVVATPGRLIDHIEGSRPPSFDRLSFLVLDEADRVLASGFAPELTKVLRVLPESKSRQTLFFSATMSDAITKLRDLASKRSARLFDLTVDQATPTSLALEYIFLPSQVKLSFLVQILRTLLKLSHRSDAIEAKTKGKGKGKGNKGKAVPPPPPDDDDDEESVARSAIIFVGSCKRCQEVTQVLLELGVDAVCLHSLLDQRRRLAALGRFKSLNCRILVATDVASRGLDIPSVDVVVNYDMPRLAVDFVHRSGRAARAGRRGKSLSLVTQHDVELVHAVEEHVGRSLALYKGVTDEDVLPLLNVVAKAQRVARQRLSEVGFDEQVAALKKRAQKRRQVTEEFKAKQAKSSSSDQEA